MPLTVIKEPAFDPAYIPHEGRPDSIQIHCISEDTNEFIYTAWDEVPRWFSIYNPEGELVAHKEFAFGEGYNIPNVPGYRVVYHVGDEYTYGVVPGQCTQNQETTTTTFPPSSTTSTPETASTTEQSTTTTEQLTTTTNSPVTEVTVQGTVTSLVALDGWGRCEWDATVSRYRDSNGQFMTSTECANTSQLAATGPSSFDTVDGVFFGAALITIGVLAKLGSWGSKLRKSTVS